LSAAAFNPVILAFLPRRCIGGAAFGKARNSAEFLYRAPTIRLAQGLALPHKLARIAALRQEGIWAAKQAIAADECGGALEGSLK
jgi:hypothetical protein